MNALHTPANPALPHIVAAHDFTIDEIVIHAASLLKDRPHVLEAAVLAYADRHAIDLISAAYVEILPDEGLLGRVNGKVSVLGKPSLLEEVGIDTAGLENEAKALRDREREVYFLSIGDHLAGLIAIPAPR